MEKLLFEVITLDWKKVDDVNAFDITDSGVYQIYGDSPIYGCNTLLYIGKAINLKNRIVGAHHKNLKSFITRQPNISFRYAVCNNFQLAEDILIIMHKPSFNSASLINVSKDTKKSLYYIQNHGERGMLHLEVTNYYFLEKEFLIEMLEPLDTK